MTGASPHPSKPGLGGPPAKLDNPQTLNLYSYVGNNPTTLRDPDGHDEEATETTSPSSDDGPSGQNPNTAPDKATQGLNERLKNAGTAVVNFLSEGSDFLQNNSWIMLLPSLMEGAETPAVQDAEQTLEDTASTIESGMTGLVRKLTSDEQMGQVMEGKGTPLAGAGTEKTLRVADKLVEQYGGKPEDWQKIGSSSSAVHKVQMPGGGNFEVHAYKNVSTGQVVEIKTSIAGH